MKKLNFTVYIGMALIMICIYFACEQTVEESDDDAATGASSSVSSAESSSSDSSSSEASSQSSTEASSSESSSETSSSSVYAFSDNFNSYSTASPWTPAGGWTSTGAQWSIVEGYDGNGVQNGATITGGELVSSYTGSNYTVSVKAKATTITDGFGYGIFARKANATEMYKLEIVYLSGTTRTRIAIYKGGSAMISTTYITGQLSTSAYYTLTLSVTGTTDPVITASITDGSTSQSINWTDTGTLYSSTGYAGITTLGAPSIIFDDFTVTEP